MNPLNKQPVNSIAALQTYITELTVYINQNNSTYTRNLSTLKQFYEQQIEQLHDTVNFHEEEILAQKNEINTLKDVLQNRNTEMKELKAKLKENQENIQELSEQCTRERQKNQQTYEHMDKLRENMQAKIDSEIEKCRIAEEDRAKTMLIVKEKQNQIRILKQEISGLESKVAERYSLPERMKQLQLQTVKDKTNIKNLQSKLNEVTQNRDFLSTNLERTKKQLEKMTLQANKSKGDLSYEVEVAVKKEKEKLNREIEALKIQNERKVYEIKDLEIKLKEKSKLCENLETKLREVNVKDERNNKQIIELKQDKDLYLNEFRNLKNQYETVIHNLEGAIPEYQKKNWTLQQENQELNIQLNTLSELLREVKAMNDMQPIRGQYRKWAELSLAAQKKLPQQEINSEDVYLRRENEEDLNPDWSKLMKDIEKIQI